MGKLALPEISSVMEDVSDESGSDNSPGRSVETPGTLCQKSAISLCLIWCVDGVCPVTSLLDCGPRPTELLTNDGIEGEGQVAGLLKKCSEVEAGVGIEGSPC
jgi:hypothetical protein